MRKINHFDLSKWFSLIILTALTLVVVIASGCASQPGQFGGSENHHELADHYYKQKKYQKAKQELLLVLKDDPDDVDANFRLGVIFGNEERFDESLAAFEKVISIDPKYNKAYYNLGVLYSKGESSEDVKRSIKYFDTFLQLEPNASQRHEIDQWKARMMPVKNQ